MRYDRVVLAYHGCDATVAERLLGGELFRPSENDYDWLGVGVYFWEYGSDRALQFARDQQRRGRIAEPAVVGALVQLGNCFDLMDTAHTRELARAYRLPRNAGATPDKKLRRLDCSILNHYLNSVDEVGVSAQPHRRAEPRLHPGRVSAQSVGMDEVDESFWEYDDFGRPLDPVTRKRRAHLRKVWEEHSKMSPEECRAYLVKLGTHNPDGTLTEHYRDDGEPSICRPTD